MTIVHNATISLMVRDSYSLRELQDLLTFLRRRGTFEFPTLDNGLFPAASLSQDAEYTGYCHVWVRDNVYIAYAHVLNGQIAPALRATAALMQFYIGHKWRFERILAGELDPGEPMNRPHIRFNGEDLSESGQRWAHAQNDALGYFLWLFCKLRQAPPDFPGAEEREMLALFALYFDYIRYWEDADSGHWEEARKIEASSIGIVLAGLKQLRSLLLILGDGALNYRDKSVTVELLDHLIDQGQQSIGRILPAESIQPGRSRRYDAALLFLIFPANVVPEATASRIVSDVVDHLQGEYGIRRYLGDSFWTSDYKKKLPPEERTIDMSERMSARDRLGSVGQEAQWCIFDPILSIIHGLRYQKHGGSDELQAQILYFNRSLGQLTAEGFIAGPFKSPELYYLENGRYVPNDVVPLLWTQANLWMAFKVIEESLRSAVGGG